MPHPITDFLNALHLALNENSLVKLTLNAPYGAEKELKSIDIRKIIIKRQEMLSFTSHYKTRDIVKNYTFAESAILLTDHLSKAFHTATLYTTAADLRWHKGVLTQTAATQKNVPAATHDRLKQQRIATAGKFYLQDLMITDAQGQVFKNAQDKFRQISKYVEIMGGLLKTIPADTPLHIVDMGSGKGYLTFALYDYIANMLNRPVTMVGVEFRADLVTLCNGIAEKAGFTSLSFVQNTIADYDCAKATVVIALHACDTATDDALYKAIKANAALVVVAPCCHKQIRQQMAQAKGAPDLAFLTRHGTYMEKQAEMVTDGMRAQLLEISGYQTKLFEFIGGEHTPKNVMIVGTRSGNRASPTAFSAAKQYFGIGYHHLERLLGLE